MNKLLITLLNIFLISGCATYGGYTPTVDDSIYNQNQQAYQPPPQQLFQSQQVFNKRGKPEVDKQGNPVYKQVPVVDQNGQPVYQQAPQAAQPQGPRNSANQDAAECQQMAKNASNTAMETLQGGAVGGLVGAAGGAALGAIMGSPGQGAAIGAAAGGIGAGAYQGLSADQKYKQIYNNCMRNRGHNVIN